MRVTLPWSRRLGLGVSRDAVRAVLVRGGRVRWHGETEVASDESLADAVVRLVAKAPRTRLLTPRLAVGFGPSLAQLKPLVGLPPIADLRLLTQLVREGTARFFLVPPRGLLVPELRRLADGAVWASALDAAAVTEIQDAAARLGLPLESIVPTVVALRHATSAKSVDWTDGDQRLRVGHAGEEVQSLQRMHANQETAAFAAIAPLAALGEDAPRLADAFGAIFTGARTPHAWHPALADARIASRRRARLIATGVAAAVMAVAAMIAPGVRATRELRAAEGQLAGGRGKRDVATRTDAELRRVTTLLEEAERFRGDARSYTLMLGALSLALPDSTAMLTFRVDSLEGSFLALSPRAADILPAIVGLSFVRDPRIVGSVTREVVGGARVERASIRFKLPRRVAAPAPRRSPIK